jgi:hypothetical protein
MDESTNANIAMLNAVVARICRASSQKSSVNVKAIAAAVTPATAFQPPILYIRAKITSDNHSFAIHG